MDAYTDQVRKSLDPYEHGAPGTRSPRWGKREQTIKVCCSHGGGLDAHLTALCDCWMRFEAVRLLVLSAATVGVDRLPSCPAPAGCLPVSCHQVSRRSPLPCQLAV